MCVGIVIPLKSKAVSNDWNSVCRALQNTLRSIAGQSHTDYQVQVVGHEAPEIDWPKSNVRRFHQLEIPIPDITGDGGFQERESFDRILDKNRKIVRGMQLLESDDITHWFYLDADDLVHRDFVKTILEFNPPHGAILDQGYLYFQDVQRFAATDQLSKLCGSTSVLNAEPISVPAGLEREDLNKIPWCRYSHFSMDQYFQEYFQTAPTPIPHPMIAYVLGHGDNCSDEFRKRPVARLKSWLKPYLTGRAVDRDFRQNFAIS